MYRYWWEQFGTVIINITLVNDAFNKNFVFPFVCNFLCLRLASSLASIHSYTINDCYNVLHLPLKFVPWIRDHPVYNYMKYPALFIVRAIFLHEISKSFKYVDNSTASFVDTDTSISVGCVGYILATHIYNYVTSFTWHIKNKFHKICKKKVCRPYSMFLIRLLLWYFKTAIDQKFHKSKSLLWR
jgi:hypothetical protein